MRAFLSFVGSNDPLSPAGTEGPLLTAFAARAAEGARFAIIVLLALDNAGETLMRERAFGCARRIAEATGAHIVGPGDPDPGPPGVAGVDDGRQPPRLYVRWRAGVDPTDPDALHDVLERTGEFLRHTGVAATDANATSGTPAMAYALASAIAWDRLPEATAFRVANPLKDPRPAAERVRALTSDRHAREAAKDRLLRLVDDGGFGAAIAEADAIRAAGGRREILAAGAVVALHAWSLVDEGELGEAKSAAAKMRGLAAALRGTKPLPGRDAIADTLATLAGRLEGIALPGVGADDVRPVEEFGAGLLLAGSTYRRLEERRLASAITRTRASLDNLLGALVAATLATYPHLENAVLLGTETRRAEALFRPGLTVGAFRFRLHALATGEYGDVEALPPGWSAAVPSVFGIGTRLDATRAAALADILKRHAETLREMNESYEIHYSPLRRAEVESAVTLLDEVLAVLAPGLDSDDLPFGVSERRALRRALAEAL